MCECFSVVFPMRNVCVLSIRDVCSYHTLLITVICKHLILTQQPSVHRTASSLLLSLNKNIFGELCYQ